MMDFIVPLLTVDSENPDFSATDRKAEIEQLVERNSAIQLCVDGKLPASELLDLIEHQGIDPFEYINMVEANIKLVMNSSTPLIVGRNAH